MKDLEEIDVKILKELLKDGRQSFTALAAKLGASKDIIWKHYTNMVAAEIITGATAQLNHPKLGYGEQALIMLSVESQYVENVFERLKKMPEITSFRCCNSSYNIGAICHLMSLSDLERVKTLISKQSPVNEIKTSIWTSVRNIPENILPGELPPESADGIDIAEVEKKPPLNIDKVDLQIIEKLTLNGRLPLSNIAEQIGVSTDTVVRRYERLRKNNYLKVSIQVDTKKLGYQAIINIYLALTDQSKTKEAAEMLCKIPGVSYLIKISGNFDLMVAALVRDCNDLIFIDEQIVKIPYIKRIDSSIRSVFPAWPLRKQCISTF